MNPTQVDESRGPWILTYTGKQFHLLEPRIEEISLVDIAHSLATQVRFTGHCCVPYHIADHCVRVAEEVEKLDPSLALCALLHDASETYLVDLPRPLKHDTPLGNPYLQIEALVEQAIARKFDLPYPMPPLVKEFDNRLLMTERRDLMHPGGPQWEATRYGQSGEPLPGTIIPRDWARSKRDFLAMALRLIVKSK